MAGSLEVPHPFQWDAKGLDASAHEAASDSPKLLKQPSRNLHALTPGFLSPSSATGNLLAIKKGSKPFPPQSWPRGGYHQPGHPHAAPQRGPETSTKTEQLGYAPNGALWPAGGLPGLLLHDPSLKVLLLPPAPGSPIPCQGRKGRAGWYLLVIL